MDGAVAVAASAVAAHREGGDVNIARVLRHLFAGPAGVRRAFPPESLERIENAIAATERTHRGQIRFVVEAGLDLTDVIAGVDARERAIEVFSQQRVWDTAHNNGLLVYLLLADRNVEIVADRGIHAPCGTAVWEQVCREMEASFRAGLFEKGVIAGIEALATQLEKHFPAGRAAPNELPDSPVVL